MRQSELAVGPEFKGFLFGKLKTKCPNRKLRFSAGPISTYCPESGVLRLVKANIINRYIQYNFMSYRKMLRQTDHAEALAKSIGLVSTVSNFAILRRRLKVWKTNNEVKIPAVWIRNAIVDTKITLEGETSKLEDFARNAPPNIVPDGAKVISIASSGGRVCAEMSLPADCVFGIARHGDEFNKIAMAKKDWLNLQKNFEKERFCGIVRLVCYGAAIVAIFAALITRLSPSFSSFLSAYVPVALGVAGIVFDVIAERIQNSIPLQFKGMVSVDETLKVIGSIKKEILERLGLIEKALG